MHSCVGNTQLHFISELIQMQYLNYSVFARKSVCFSLIEIPTKILFTVLNLNPGTFDPSRIGGWQLPVFSALAKKRPYLTGLVYSLVSLALLLSTGGFSEHTCSSDSSRVLFSQAHVGILSRFFFSSSERTSRLVTREICHPDRRITDRLVTFTADEIEFESPFEFLGAVETTMRWRRDLRPTNDLLRRSTM